MFDVIVVGLGGVGAAACYALAKKGLKVLGIDQYQPPHGFGSSHGDTRIIRKSYFEHPNYVPLLKSAYSLWQEIEARSESQLYYPTGLLEIGPVDGVVIQGILRSAAEHQLSIDMLSMRQVREQYPGIYVDPSWQAVFERDAGYLLVEKCVATYLEHAEQLGVTLCYHQKMISWAGQSQGVQVRLQDETLHAKKLVLCAGPWAQQALATYDLPLNVLRKHMYWYRCDRQDYLQSHGFPCFFFDTPDGFYYGFPDHDTFGLKVARHSGGTPVQCVDGTHDRDQEDQQLVEKFLKQYMPNVLGTQANTSALTRWSGCYYTMTPDENFIVDRLPDYSQVVVIAGLSGHGFKFTSVLGDIASHLVAETDCGLDIGFLGINRFANAN